MGVSKMVGLENHGKSQLSPFEKGRFHGAEGDSMTKKKWSYDTQNDEILGVANVFLFFFSWVRPW